jgi:hypothetical protein
MSKTATPSTAQVANLRALADLLDSVDLPHLPYITSSVDGTISADWFLMHKEETHEGQKAAAVEIVRTIGGHWDKIDTYSDFVYRQKRDGVTLDVQVTREAVCERIVTGTRQVTVPAVEATPERVQTVEDVEWRCLPLLAEVES